MTDTIQVPWELLFRAKTWLQALCFKDSIENLEGVQSTIDDLRSLLYKTQPAKEEPKYTEKDRLFLHAAHRDAGYSRNESESRTNTILEREKAKLDAEHSPHYYNRQSEHRPGDLQGLLQQMLCEANESYNADDHQGAAATIALMNLLVSQCTIIPHLGDAIDACLESAQKLKSWYEQARMQVDAPKPEEMP